MHALVLPNPKLGPKQVYFILFVIYSFLFISNLLLIRHYLPPALPLSYLSVLLAKCPQSFLQHRLGPIQVIYSLIYPDNPTDLAPAAYPIKCTYYSPLAFVTELICPLHAHLFTPTSNMGLQRFIYFTTIVTETRHFT